MRPALILALSLLSAVPAAVHAAPEVNKADESRLEKITLRHVNPNDAVLSLVHEAGMPNHLKGLVGYPLDNSVLADGTPDALRLLKEGLSFLDVPEQDLGDQKFRMVLRPQRATAEAVRAVVLAQAGAGTATVVDKDLVLEGSKAWLKQARGTALRTEWAKEAITLTLLVTPSTDKPGTPKRYAKASGPSFQSGKTADGFTTLTLPAGTDLKIVGDQLVSDAATGRLVVTGLVTITAPNGFKLETSGVRLTITGMKKGEPVVLKLEPARD